MWCKECRQSCDVHTIDEGIGPYEYWGAKYVDKQLVEVSVCCDGELLHYDPMEDEDPSDANTQYDFVQRLIEAQKLK